MKVLIYVLSDLEDSLKFQEMSEIDNHSVDYYSLNSGANGSMSVLGNNSMHAYESTLARVH